MPDLDEKILEGSDSLDHGTGEESPLFYGRSTMDAGLLSKETRHRVNTEPGGGSGRERGTISDR